ncbi:MAG: hypothetical protein CL610_05060 [Anaerolineaceae bacterium]|nr:hypothetical protein [Anaerolineaceae bacterium]
MSDKQKKFGILLAGLAGLVLVAILVILTNQPTPQPTASNTLATLSPTIIANLTALPSAEPVGGNEAAVLNELQTAVNACDDYSDTRRQQMSQHIRWLLNPSTIPADIAIVAGENLMGRLTFGMAVYTSTEWRLLERPAQSCLIPIGRTLNDMLVAAGEDPLTIYDES